jgi:cyclophilin family peptidyl-prolyl cis-trans isomerase
MKIWFITIFTIFLVSCQNSGQPILDQTSTVFGRVTSEQGVKIDSCIVGFLTPDTDTASIQNDSILTQSFEVITSSVNGHYRLDWFLGPVPLPYDRMYAIKEGYRRWHFYNSVDKIVTVKMYTDSLNIILIK